MPVTKRLNAADFAEGVVDVVFIELIGGLRVSARKECEFIVGHKCE